MITVSAFRWVPEFAHGLPRDLRVRWALEEAGLAYSTRLIDHGDLKAADYLAVQPFGQIPVYEEDGLVLFESGAIVLHIAERSDTLLPKDAHSRARTVQWVIAALNSLEPFLINLMMIDVFHAEEGWAKQGRLHAMDMAQRRVAQVSQALGHRSYLDGEHFTAGDLIMAASLDVVRHTDLVTGDPRLAAYVSRCKARPAYQRALQAQVADFNKAAERLA
jgi:glutathione S-transferase